MGEKSDFAVGFRVVAIDDSTFFNDQGNRAFEARLGESDRALMIE